MCIRDRFGGLIGATWVAAGTDAVKFVGLIGKVLLPAVMSPIVAGLIALTATYLAYRITSRGADATVKRGFRRFQVVSGSMVALAHGTNDAQKTMGIITLTLITAGLLPPDAGPPFWVVLSAGVAIGLGTYMGGWRIIRTLGKRVSDIQPPQGFAAETSSASVILVSSHLGFALSTTQVCTGSIFGAGAARRLASVPAATHVAPMSPPNSACDELEGMPRNQVSRFHRIAPTSPAKITVGVILVSSTRPLEIVFATWTDRNAPMRLRTPAMITAVRGFSARVAIDVAMALAVS